MASKLTNIFFIAFFFISISTVAQQESFTPTKGKITFTSSEIITDQKLAMKSYNEMTKKMILKLKNAIKEEKLAIKDDIDTNKLELVTDTLSSILPELLQQKKSKIDHSYIYKNSVIQYTAMQNGVSKGDFFTLIDPAKSTTTLIIKTDTLETKGESEPFKYSKNRDFSIKEFRDEKRTISGYSCFKVIFSYKKEEEPFNEDISNSEKEFLQYISSFKYYKEFWVTESVKSLYHPVCKDKEILDKYYPLEIKEYNDLTKGIEQVHLLKHISIFK